MPSYRPILFTVVPVGQKLVRTVTLYEDTWWTHIVVRHPELSGSLQVVEEAVTRPTAIYASSSQAGSLLFVKNGIADTAGRLLKVVVKADRSIATAYFSSSSGGSQLWP